MAYCSHGDIRIALGERTYIALTDKNQNNVADSNVATAAINAADAVIDLHIANRYAIPCTSNSTRYISRDLAIQELFSGSLQPETFAPDQREYYADKYTSWMRMLSGVATGAAKIPGKTPTGVLPEISTGLAGDDVEKVFTMTRQQVGGTTIDTDESGSMDVW